MIFCRGVQKPAAGTTVHHRTLLAQQAGKQDRNSTPLHTELIYSLKA